MTGCISPLSFVLSLHQTLSFLPKNDLKLPHKHHPHPLCFFDLVATINIDRVGHSLTWIWLCHFFCYQVCSDLPIASASHATLVDSATDSSNAELKWFLVFVFSLKQSHCPHMLTPYFDTCQDGVLKRRKCCCLEGSVGFGRLMVRRLEILLTGGRLSWLDFVGPRFGRRYFV